MTYASAARAIRHVFIRNLELPAQIGVWRHEHGKEQPVRINVDLAVEDLIDLGDDLKKVVDYGVIEGKIRAILAEGHLNLVETLAEEVAAHCLAHPRAASVKVTIEKLDKEPGAVGVEIVRAKVSA